MVMENLFYGCEIEKKFDLKGSERNRLVDPSTQQGEIVLLDENLVQSEYYSQPKVELEWLELSFNLF